MACPIPLGGHNYCLAIVLYQRAQYIMRTMKGTTSQSNLTEGSIAAAHGQFNRIRIHQVAPLCRVTPIWYTLIGIRTVPVLPHAQSLGWTYPDMWWASLFWLSKLPIHVKGSGPPKYMVPYSLDHPRLHPEQHRNRLSSFCRAHGRDRQTTLLRL